MIERFKNYINQHNLFYKEQKILLAISGGVDSMVMLDLFKKAEFKIAVAHINYKKRGEASDKDEALVKAVCVNNGITFYSIEFPKELAARGNFQEKARDFRYDWFNNLCYEFGYEKIATAHHNDDLIETFFMNLFRGSGLHGLSSIKSVNGNIIRPLLDYHKDEMYEYAEKNNIEFREDKSNSSEIYQRNFIRNKVIKLIAERSQDYINGIDISISNINRTNDLLNEILKDKIKKSSDIFSIIPYDLLEKYNDKSLMIFYLVREYGFNLVQVKDLMKAELLGSKILSATHEIIKDREGYLLIKKDVENTQNCIVKNDGVYKWNELDINVETISKGNLSNQIQNKRSQILAFDSNPFPLTFRSKKEGDTFRPIGLNGQQQSIKKYFVDHKFSYLEKLNCIIVQKEKEILSLFPHRLSELVKTKESSEFFIKIETLGND